MPTETLEIDLKKKGSLVEIYIKAPKQVEEYYKNLSVDQPKESVKWKTPEGAGCKFYCVSPDSIREDTQLIYNLEGIRVFSDFGHAPMENGTINIGFLRAVGISEGISFNSLDFTITNLDCETFARYLGQALKALISERLSSHEVKATITYEI